MDAPLCGRQARTRFPTGSRPSGLGPSSLGRCWQGPGLSWPRRRRAPTGTTFLIAVLVLAGTATTAQASPWLPLQEGAFWRYSLHRDRTLGRGLDSSRSFVRGQVEQRVVAAKEPESPARQRYALRVKTSERSLPDGDFEQREFEQQLSSDKGGVLLHGSRLYWTTSGPDVEVEYDPPLRLLPAKPRLGGRWDAGTLRNRGLRFALQGEVVGFEDIEVGGAVYERCLHVRFSGTVSGEKIVGPPEEQRIQRDLWLRRGVGIVKEVTAFSIETLGPDLAPLALSELVTQELQMYRVDP